MKTITQKLIKIALLCSIFFSLFSAQAQAPQKMSYQAVIRNANNALLENKSIGMRISVLQGTEKGTPVYVETQTVTTNSNGLVTLQIGGGTVERGAFSSISWGTNSYYIKTETDPTGGNNYTIEGTSQLMSVPYALYAAASPSSNWTSSGKDIGNTNNGNVGIGTSNPNAKFEIKSSNHAKPTNTDGLLIPKIDAFPEMNPTEAQQGMMVNLTKTAIFEGKFLPSGFYYWDNQLMSWRAIAATGVAWDTGGNAGTNAATNFIGTTDDNDLVFKRNNTKAGFLGNINTAFGKDALSSVTDTYSFNTAIGLESQKATTTGFANTGVGARSLLTNTVGNYNTALGILSMTNNETGSYNTATGSYSLSSNISGGSNSAHGYSALEKNTSGGNNTASGNSALYANTIGSFNTAHGARSLYSNTTGNYNTALGDESLTYAITASKNTATGYGSLYVNTGDENTATGFQALNNNKIGFYNTAFGSQASLLNVSGNYNTAIGTNALARNLSSENTAVGYGAISNSTTGSQNTAVGNYAGQNTTTGRRNVFLGHYAAYGNNGGNYNVAIGAYTALNSNYNNSIAIGDVSGVSASNQARIGTNTTTSIGGAVGWSTVSDQRFKKDIQKNVPGLEFIKKLRPVTYHLDMDAMAELYKTPDSLRKKDSEILMSKMLQTGFIAQEVEAAAKSVGFDFSGVDTPKNENDFYGLRYAEFVVPLVKALQELEAKNEALESKNEQIEKEFHELKIQNDNLALLLKAIEAKISK
jgi:trimeric autotransporter adhesin